MAGYSSKPLAQKLGIKSDFELQVINSPMDYEQLAGPLPAGVTLVEDSSHEIDMVHFFAESRQELTAAMPQLVNAIKPNGMIWVSWPKKSSKVPTDVTEDVIRAVILPLGLVDVKVCAVDEIWSGLKLMIRKENRKQ